MHKRAIVRSQSNRLKKYGEKKTNYIDKITDCNHEVFMGIVMFYISWNFLKLNPFVFLAWILLLVFYSWKIEFKPTMVFINYCFEVLYLIKKIKNVREPTGDEKGDPNKIKDEMEIKDISNIEQDCSTNQNQDTLNATEDVDNTENKLTPKVNVESPNNIEEALEEEEHCECNDVNNCKLNGKLMEMFNNGESVEKMSEFKTQWMNSLKNESESYEKRKCGNDHTDDLKENSNDKTTDNFNIKGKTLCANTGCTKPCLHRCSRCLQVSFCSRACSIQFWPKHQLSCTPWQSRLSEVD